MGFSALPNEFQFLPSGCQSSEQHSFVSGKQSSHHADIICMIYLLCCRQCLVFSWGLHVLVSLVGVSSTTCLSDKLVVAVDLRVCVAVYLPLSRVYLTFRAFVVCDQEYFTVPMQEHALTYAYSGGYRATLSKEKNVHPHPSSSQSRSINIKKGSKLNCDVLVVHTLAPCCIQHTCRLCPCLCHFTNIDNSSKIPVSQTSSKRCCVTTSLRFIQAFSLQFIWAE